MPDYKMKITLYNYKKANSAKRRGTLKTSQLSTNNDDDSISVDNSECEQTFFNC